MVPSPCGWLSLPKNLTTNLPHISDHIVEFDVTLSSRFEPTLERMWMMHHFPNLGLLTLTFVMINIDTSDNSEDQDDSKENYPPKIPQFLTLPNLESLKIVVKDQNEIGQDDGISSICQGLLNSASNVVNVTIYVSFYPDFTPCTKLEMLAYTYVHFRDKWTHEEVYVDFPILTWMLDTCLDYVTRLTLSCRHDWNDLHEQIFMLPSMTKLVVLHIKGMFPLGNFLHQDHLPNLTHVTFSGYNRYGVCLPDTFENFDLPHERITSLDVDAVYRYFDQDVETAMTIHRVTEVLQSFATWNLTSGLVEIESDHDTTDVLAVLRGVVAWKGLAQTSVNFEVSEGPTFVLDADMEDILLSCQSLRWIRLLGFMMPEEEKELFEEFIEEHALPIRLY
ncbi:hypothetical protein Fcan01_10301 [Folsomia candida]|uniref:Uncharacterized protein n=1 Tax=Folsomia candida TaxID=158441 RepID=A0A226E891_FOLCA|nr:hypothetical protein Fcan01_10301 [Folsomia candida]